jgi:hypothetical protein
VTDPYLLSASDDAPVPAALADRISELARRMGVPRTMLGDMPSELLDQMEQFAAHTKATEQTWGELAGSIARTLTAAGFRRHNACGPRGGFGVCMWDDGVIVGWSTTEYPEDAVSPFEKMVEQAMIPALEQILVATGFAACIIPEGEDNAGDIRVTGWQEPGSITAVVEQ